MDKIKEWAKAATGGFAAMAMISTALLASEEVRALFPSAWVAVLTILAAGGTLFGLVGGVPNQLNHKQIQNAPAKELAKATGNIAGAVAVASAEAVTGAINSYITEKAKDFPQPARAQVEEIASAASDIGLHVTSGVVSHVISRFDKAMR